MYHPDETIAAVSSPSVSAGRSGAGILRLSGPETFSIIRQIEGKDIPSMRGAYPVCFEVHGATCEAMVYVFCGPHSYTGQDMAEIHLEAPEVFVRQIYHRLLESAQPAGPGEFTYRAYLSGRMDLSQAEAVAQIVSGSNAVHLAAAEKLLAGGLAGTVAKVRGELLEILSLLEAGMDFSEETIEFVSSQEARDRVDRIKLQLTKLLDGPVTLERMIDLPAVGIAGCVNAGKSTLLNALLGRRRSITSNRQATTRDVLSDILRLEQIDCVLFDCAGLAGAGGELDELDVMAQQAARSALESADLVIFCVDVTKNDLKEDEAIFQGIKRNAIVPAATKCDELEERNVREKLDLLGSQFGCPFIAVSGQAKSGLDTLRGIIQERLLSGRPSGEEAENRLALNQRHRRILQEAVKGLADCADELIRENTEIAAMLLRDVRGGLGGVEHEAVDESILERIFSRFCIGK